MVSESQKPVKRKVCSVSKKVDSCAVMDRIGLVLTGESRKR